MLRELTFGPPPNEASASYSNWYANLSPISTLEVGSVVGDTMRLRQCSENDSLVRPLWTVWRILSTEKSPIAFGRSVLRHVPTEGYRAPFCGVLGFEFGF